LLLLEKGNVGGRSDGGSGHAAFAGMELRESLLIDLNPRAGGTGGLRQLNDVGQSGQNFGRFHGRFGIDERLVRMIGMRGVRKDALARVKGVGSGRWRSGVRGI